MDAPLPATNLLPGAPAPDVVAADAWPAAAVQRIAELETLLAAERERNRQLEERVKELEARLGRNSDNSSKPPSTDPPWRKRKYPPKKGPSGRKPGGQKGHKAARRELVPEEKLAGLAILRPESCES
ncbi:MAG: hypothetical protein FJ125_06880, partial [Deltaproteobacteria bacterium]|nr:hypothetical protein [Deltaproteobacteria bacterium]